MAADLTAHLHRGMSEPFARPQSDCCFFVADWVELCTGIDPAADLRGRYHNLAGALRLVTLWGGFETMWRVHMALAGFNTTREPQDGDVGVVIDAAGQTVAAIRVGDKWAAKSATGLAIEDFRMVVAWSIPRG